MPFIHTIEAHEDAFHRLSELIAKEVEPGSTADIELETEINELTIAIREFERRTVQRIRYSLLDAKIFNLQKAISKHRPLCHCA